MQEYGFSAYDFRGAEVDEDDAYRLGFALSDFFDPGTVVVGRDHRSRSKRMKDALIAGLRPEIEVEDVGMATTDLVSYTTMVKETSGGVAVTASHMPPGYHGIKPLTSEGRIFDEGELRKTLELYRENSERKSVYPEFQERHLGKPYENYVEALVSRYDEMFEEDLSGMRIGVDTGNGVGVLTLPFALKSLGVEEDDLYLVNQEIDPDFPGRDPDPVRDELRELSELVFEEELDIGLALDGDADRVVYVNEKGEKISGDESLGILAEKYLEGTEAERPLIACSGNTSQLVEDKVVRAGGFMDYQPVGAVFPAKRALENDDVIIGGQPNGHFLDPSFTPYDSGTLFGVLMPGVMKQRLKSLGDLQRDLPQYDISRMNFETGEKEKALEVLRNMVGIRAADRDFNGIYRTKIGGGALSDVGLSRNLIFRSSGSEDVLRLTLESKINAELLGELGDELQRELEEQSS